MTYIPEGFNRKQQDEQDVSWVMWQQQRSEAKARSWWSSKSIGTKLYAEASWFKTRLPRGPGNGFHVGREWHIEVVFRQKVELLRFWIQWKLQTSVAMQCDSQDQIEFRERKMRKVDLQNLMIFSSLQLFSIFFLRFSSQSMGLRCTQVASALCVSTESAEANKVQRRKSKVCARIATLNWGCIKDTTGLAYCTQSGIASFGHSKFEAKKNFRPGRRRELKTITCVVAFRTS